MIVAISGLFSYPFIRGQELPQRYVSETKVFHDHGHLEMSLAAGSKQFPRLVPHLVGTHSLTKELVGDPLDSDLLFGYFRIVEALRVASKGLLRGNIPEEHQDALHAAGGHVKINVPEGVALVSSDVTVPQYPVIQDRKAAPVLIGDHAGQLWLCDDLIL